MTRSVSNLNTQKLEKIFSIVNWSLIGVMVLLNILWLLEPKIFGNIVMMITVVIIFVLALLHGYRRYGIKNIAVFFAITAVVSNTFEAVSIRTGFPFGNYYYTMSGPRIFSVPVMVIVAYFGMGYLSWTLSLIFNRQLGKKLKGLQVFLVPFVASFIMVMWDVVMDPIAATIKKTWIWENGGNYFGVPISNYFGWFFVVYVFLQLFTIYIYKFDKIKSDTYYKNSFWTQCSITYGIVGFTYIIQTVLSNSNKEIYTATGLISVFTMIFIAFLSVISVMNSNEIRYVEEKLVTPDNEAVKSFATTRN